MYIKYAGNADFSYISTVYYNRGYGHGRKSNTSRNRNRSAAKYVSSDANYEIGNNHGDVWRLRNRVTPLDGVRFTFDFSVTFRSKINYVII